ncbi:LysR substrate-binding domain-containing protein [Paraferrimonas sedimenticola]|nr:LysR substrate-binding domain-containing protein [Paraferrimonas sedimenticola]
MRYTLKQLAVFNAIAQTQSVSQAAKQLALTQSATSMALAQLERQLGRALFERQNKRMRLTSWGEWLRPRAKRLLADATQIETGLFEQHKISGELSIAVSQTPASHLFPQLVRACDQQYPEVRIEMRVANTGSVINAVRDYQCDFGIIEGRCDDVRIAQQLWCEDHLSIVASGNHPLVGKASLTLADLEQAKWVLRESGSGVRMIFDSAMHGHLGELSVWREYDHVGTILALVETGSYLTCLPYLDVAHGLADGRLVEFNFDQLNMQRPLSFIWRAEDGDNLLREKVIELAMQEVQR